MLPKFEGRLSPLAKWKWLKAESDIIMAKQAQKGHFIQKFPFKSAHVHPKLGYDNARYYTIHITAWLFIDKPHDASASVARGCQR